MRQPIFKQKTDILSLNLEKNEEYTLMLMDNTLVHPLLISINLLVVPPSSQAFKQTNLSADESAVPISEISGAWDRSPSRPNLDTMNTDGSSSSRLSSSSSLVSMATAPSSTPADLF